MFDHIGYSYEARAMPFDMEAARPPTSLSGNLSLLHKIFKAFTQTRVKKLLGDCRPTQRFTTEARRLEEGRNPYDNAFIATPVPWTEGVLTHGQIGWAATLEEELQKTVWLEDSSLTGRVL